MYEEDEVVNDGIIVIVKYTSAPYFVVEIRGDKFGGNMVIRVACQFSDKD